MTLSTEKEEEGTVVPSCCGNGEYLGTQFHKLDHNCPNLYIGSRIKMVQVGLPNQGWSERLVGGLSILSLVESYAGFTSIWTVPISPFGPYKLA